MSDEHGNESDRPARRSFIDEARRAQIVACSLDVIAAEGYARASLARIAARAGISKGVISYHFADKDELMMQAVTVVYTAAAEAMGPRIRAETSAPDALRAYIEANLAYFRDNLATGRALKEILTHFQPKEGVLPTDRIYDEEAVAALEEIFLWGQREGAFRPFLTRVMALALRRAIDGVLDYWSFHVDHDLDAYARELVDLFDLATAATPTTTTATARKADA